MNLCGSNRQMPGLNWGHSRPQPEVPGVELPALSFAEPPANLRQWFSDTTISLWIHQEVQGFLWRDLGVQTRHASADIRGQIAVLALAMVSLVFGSEEIARVCRTDATFQQLAGGAAFFPHELWTTRRKYRAELEQILTGVFSQAIRSRFGLVSSLLPAELHEDLRRHAAERLEIARHIDACVTW